MSRTSDWPCPVNQRHRVENGQSRAEKVSTALPSRAHAANKRSARTSRRYTEAKRDVRRRTPARHSQPVYNGQRAGAHYPDLDRGYGYGAYGPAPYSNTGD